MHHNSWDSECLSCGAHWLQSCPCTQEQVEEANKKREELLSSDKWMTLSWDKLKERIGIK